MLQDQPERAIRVWARMKHLNLMPDIRTYELLFSLFVNVNAPYEDADIISQAVAAKRINAIEMDMMRNGFQHNLFTLQNLVSVASLSFTVVSVHCSETRMQTIFLNSLR